MGEILTEEMIAIREIPADFVEARHILASEAGKAIGVRVSMGLRANDSITWTDLAGTGIERRDLSGLVPSGMRALTIAVERGSTLGGLLRPGDRIDLLLTAAQDTQEEKTVPLLQNLLVIAVGNDLGGPGQPGAMKSRDITLSVTATQAQAITQARSLGPLTVVLRNPDDIVVVKDMPATSSRDLHQSLAGLQKQRGLLDLLGEDKKKSHKEIEHVR
jgi:pilus assembly protein CpaB